MFKLQKPDTVLWPVTIAIPQDGGRVSKSRCKIEFKLLDQDDYTHWVQNGDDRDFLRQVVVGWEEVGDESGEPLSFSETARDQLLGIAYVRGAMVLAYHEIASGGASRKN